MSVSRPIDGARTDVRSSVPPTDASGDAPGDAPGDASTDTALAEESSGSATTELIASLFERTRQLGLVEAQAAELTSLGIAATYGPHSEPSDIVSMRSLLVFAALSHGDIDLADQALSLPGEPKTPELHLLDLAARLYRACVGAERDPSLPLPAMNALTEALMPVMAIDTPEARLSRGYAGLTLSEALLRIGDVGAARQQLEAVADEPGMAPGLAVVAGMLLGGLEQAVGRSDLALGHIQVALHRATQLGGTTDEERLLRLVLVGLLLADNRRYGLTILDDITAGKYGPPPTGYGTVARLYRLLLQLVEPPPLPLLARAAIREELTWLRGRHNSAGWSLLFIGLCAGALAGSGERCEAYGILVQSAAELRCRYMDGVADLCEREITSMRHELGPDAFDALLTEAQKRRKELATLHSDSRTP